MPPIDDLTQLEEFLADDSGEMEDRFQLAMKVQKMIMPFCKGGDLLDWRGHYLNGKYWHDSGWFESPEKRLQSMVREALILGLMRVPQLQRLADAVEAGVELEEPIPLGTLGIRHECTFCSAHFNLAFNGKGFVAFNDPCPYPDGILTEFELNVPSGTIVADDDLREWFPSDEDYSVNALLGCHLTSLAYEKVGMAHGFVGNTCPYIYRNGDDKFVIGSYRESIFDHKKREYSDNPDPCPWGEPVASICTDLWWYSIADYDDFVRRVAHYTPDRTVEEFVNRPTVNTVDVKPGVYRFRQEQGVNRDAGIVEFATFEWVRDPDPVRDYLKEEREKSYTATEVLIQQCVSAPWRYLGVRIDQNLSLKEAIKLWKEKTPEEQLQTLARAADQIMCTLGGGVEWHENGFPRCAMTEEVRQLAAEYGDIPAFDFQANWYPISPGYGGLCLGAGVREDHDDPRISLAPSFVELGLNICQNVIKYGEKPRLNRDVWPPAYEVADARQRMELFVQCYRGLRRYYPDIVFDAEFDRWMSETDLEKYVAEFDFGPDHPPKEEWVTPGKGPPKTLKKGEYFELDTAKLQSGRRLNPPKIVGATQSEMGHLHLEYDHALNQKTPSKIVGRVLRGTGDGHHSRHLVVAFDYGTKEMREREWAIDELEMEAVRQFNDSTEYANLLEARKAGFAEAKSKKKRKKKARKKGT